MSAEFTSARIIQILLKRGVSLGVQGDHLLCKPKRLVKDLAAAIRDHKLEIIEALWLKAISHNSCWQCSFFEENPNFPQSIEPGRCTGTPHDGFTKRWPAANIGRCFRPRTKAFLTSHRNIHQGQGKDQSSYNNLTPRNEPPASEDATIGVNTILDRQRSYREGPPYPDSQGRVKCFYCSRLIDEKWCQVRKETMYGISLLNTCTDFAPAGHNNTGKMRPNSP